MTRRITIDPVTRIEGHARVLIDLEDDGTIRTAGLLVNELRGFERILVGMQADRMPLVTARICGVCPSGALRHDDYHVVKNFYRDLVFSRRMERFL